MKAIKAAFLFVFSILMVGCFESPEFPDTPNIEFVDISFGRAATPAQQDSIVIELAFEDGDGDLGIAGDPRRFPFHEYDLFLTDGTTIVETIHHTNESSTGEFPLLDVPDGATGSLVSFNEQPSRPDNCQNYRVINLYVDDADKDILDDGDSVEPKQGYSIVTNKFLIEPNPYFNNIHVVFLKKVNGRFEKYDWGSCQNFDGSFTTLVDDPRPLSGTIRYTMYSYGFESIMGDPNTEWQMKFVVFDRALHKSDTVTTQFYLEDITR